MLTESHMVSLGGGLWKCVLCGIMKRKADIRRHIEAKHMDNAGVSCSNCGKSFKNRDSMRKHACLGRLSMRACLIILNNTKLYTNILKQNLG